MLPAGDYLPTRRSEWRRRCQETVTSVQDVPLLE